MPRPKFRATEEQHRDVKKLAGFGLTQAQICSVVGIPSIGVLKKHFGRELSRGPAEAKAKVMATAVRAALSGRDPAMTIFMCKTRGRWSTSAIPEEQERQDGPARFIITEYAPRRTLADQAIVDEFQARRTHEDHLPEWDGDRVENPDEEED
jgi:hypothetical protein